MRNLLISTYITLLTDRELPPDANIINSPTLQLCPIQVNEEYCQKWNIRARDYYLLCKNGEAISNSLYRIGGMNTVNLNNDYFMLLKHVEAYYTDEIIELCNKTAPNSLRTKETKPEHLESRWVI